MKSEFLKLAFKVKEDKEKLASNSQRAEKADLLALEIAKKVSYLINFNLECRSKIIDCRHWKRKRKIKIRNFRYKKIKTIIAIIATITIIIIVITTTK